MPFCRHQGLMESHWMMYSFQLKLCSYWFFKGIVHEKLYRLVHNLIKVQCHNTLDSKFCNQFLIASRQQSENHPPADNGRGNNNHLIKKLQGRSLILSLIFRRLPVVEAIDILLSKIPSQPRCGAAARHHRRWPGAARVARWPPRARVQGESWGWGEKQRIGWKIMIFKPRANNCTVQSKPEIWTKVNHSTVFHVVVLYLLTFFSR